MAKGEQTEKRAEQTAMGFELRAAGMGQGGPG